ncbi:tripartite tricarboxylate transporter substrate binding protein [Bordetella tumbae]
METDIMNRLKAVAAGMLAICSALAMASSFARAAQWPTDKPIRLVVPYPAGGNSDVIGRIFARKLGDALHQSVIVDNRPGAGGSIGAALAAKADPDGYTLLLGDIATHAINHLSMPNLSYDAQADFAPVSRLTSISLLLVINPKYKFKSVQDFIAHAKAHPGQMAYATGGNGTPSQLAMEMLRGATGLDMLPIPYKGSAPALTDVVSGQVDAMIDGAATPLVKSGKLDLLAVTADRSPAFPDTPTLSEAGVPGYRFVSWHGVFAPKGTPQPIVDRLAQELQRAAQDPEVQKQLQGLGIGLNTQNGPAFASFIADQRQSIEAMVKERGLKLAQ